MCPGETCDPNNPDDPTWLQRWLKNNYKEKNGLTWLPPELTDIFDVVCLYEVCKIFVQLNYRINNQT